MRGASATQTAERSNTMTIKWNPTKNVAELIHNGRTVCVSETTLTKIDAGMLALLIEAKHAPSVAVQVPSYSSTRQRRVYHNALTTIL